MSFTVQHIRSGEENRRPRPDELVVGQIAVNYENNSPGMFFRTDTGALIKVGPMHIGPTAPVQVNWTESSVGEQWLDTTYSDQPFLKIWDGSEWLQVASSVTVATTFVPPTSAVGLPSGAVWNNSGTLTIVS